MKWNPATRQVATDTQQVTLKKFIICEKIINIKLQVYKWMTNSEILASNRWKKDDGNRFGNKGAVLFKLLNYIYLYNWEYSWLAANGGVIFL